MALRRGLGRVPGAQGTRLIERNLMVVRHGWIIILSGFFEPVLYLLGIGFGVGSLVGHVDAGGRSVDYAHFVAPALMATSAMNGGIYESTFNLFWKLRHSRLYDLVLASPMGVADIASGEVGYAMMRGTLYAVVFAVLMAVLGLDSSPWALLSVPAAVLIVFSFASAGVAATTWVRSWADFDVIQLVLLPLFLFSATFYTLATYPPPLQVVVQLTPLYHGVHLIRALSLGTVDAWCLVDIAYLAAFGLIGVSIASRRLAGLLLR